MTTTLNEPGLLRRIAPALSLFLIAPLVAEGVLFAIGLVLTTATNLYAFPFTPRPAQMAAVLVLVALLAVAAFRLPGTGDGAPGAVPHPVVVAAMGVVAGAVFFMTLDALHGWGLHRSDAGRGRRAGSRGPELGRPRRLDPDAHARARRRRVADLRMARVPRVAGATRHTGRGHHRERRVRGHRRGRDRGGGDPYPPAHQSQDVAK